MQQEQYTSDAICRAMGLDGFVDREWISSKASSVRLLLKPSFSPEVCITIARTLSSVRLSVIALSEMLWLQPTPCRLMEYRDVVDVSSEQFEEITRDFSSAHNKSRNRRDVIWIDGMAMDCCWASPEEVRRFGEHALSGREDFTSRFVTLAWKSCSVPALKNALARCGPYLGLSLPLEPEPKPARMLRIIVLGVPEEKSEFFRLLSAASSCPALTNAGSPPPSNDPRSPDTTPSMRPLP
jgi:hypothetical protein